MRTRMINVLAGLAAACSVAVNTAIAEDFLISVPVELADIPQDASPMVKCRAVVGDGATIIGIGEVHLQDARSSFADVVTVAFDVFEGSAYAASDATGYVCQLLMVPDADHVVLSWERCEEAGINPSANPLICGARGAEVVGRVSGTF